MSEMTKAFLTSESQTWATPWPVIHTLEAEGFRFTLDVAAGIETAKAPKFYTETENAFFQDWIHDASGGDIWINPPYGDKRFPVSMWVEKAWRYRRVMNTVLLLPANKTDQDWFHDLVIPDGQYRPVRGRIGFIDGLGQSVSGNSQGSMLIIFGPEKYPCAPVTFDWKAIRKAGRIAA